MNSTLKPVLYIEASEVVLLKRYDGAGVPFLLSLSRVLVGAQSDPSINVDDPISDEFFFVAWNEASKVNASIYDKVTNRSEGSAFVVSSF